MSTESFKSKLKQAKAYLKWELKTNASTLISYSVLTITLMIFAFIFCSMLGNSLNLNNMSEKDFSTGIDYVFFSKVMHFKDYRDMLFYLFGVLGNGIVVGITIVSSLSYIAKSLGYLHNKRQTDMFGSFPSSRATTYISKIFSAYVISVIPALIFTLIVTLLSICLGQPVSSFTIPSIFGIIIGAFVNISVYALFAVCCGTTLNSVIMYIAINVIYPVVFLLAKAIINGFTYGITEPMHAKESLLPTALCPITAYNGNYVLYWLFFGIVVLAAGTYLVIKRKSEFAQSPFAYNAIGHIFKLCVALLFGLSFGTISGALNLFSNGLLSFAIGFLFTGLVSFVITHLILLKSFQKLLKSIFSFVALFAIIMVAVTALDSNSNNYEKLIPDIDDIASGGIVDSSDIYSDIYLDKATESMDFDTYTKKISEDFTDRESIEKIINIEKKAFEYMTATTSRKFSIGIETLMVQLQNTSTLEIGEYNEMYYNSLYSNTNDWTELSIFGVSYKLNNGSYVNQNFIEHWYYGDLTNLYRDNFNNSFESNINDEYSKLTKNVNHLTKHSNIASPCNGNGYFLCINKYQKSEDGKSVDDFEPYAVALSKKSNDNKRLAPLDTENKAIVENICNAYLKDLQEKPELMDKALSLWKISNSDILQYNHDVDTEKNDYGYSIYVMLKHPDANLMLTLDGKKFIIFDSFENTIKALREANIIDDNNMIASDANHTATYNIN